MDPGRTAAVLSDHSGDDREKGRRKQLRKGRVHVVTPFRYVGGTANVTDDARAGRPRQPN